MSDTSIGTASMRLTLDTADYTVALDRAKAQQAGLGEAAAQEADKMTAAQKRVVASLDNQIAKLGLTREEWLQYKVITQTTGETQTALLTKIKANTVELTKQGNAAEKAGVQFNKYGISAKQEAAALRQVPAQLTDIFVSLQGGQNPLTVLLQQGGQLKDIFGGIVPAARALGGALLNLINPYTVLAAAMGSIAIAAYQGSQETVAYAKALALTGSASGATVDTLASMAYQMDRLDVTQHKAAESLVAVAASGKFTVDQFQMVATAATQMESATGQALDKTVDQFAALATDPVNAVVKLNQETHFLTEEIYQQVKALQAEGDTHAAATLAMDAYATAVANRTAQVKENLGTLESAWRALGLGARWAWDQMMDIGRDPSRAEQIVRLAAKLQEIQHPSNWASYVQLGPEGSKARTDAAAALRKQIGDLQNDYVNEQKAANRAAAGQEANDYAIAQEQNVAAHQSADAKRAAEIARSRKESNLKAERAITAGDKELAARIRSNQTAYEAALNAEAKKKGNGGVRSLANAQASADLDAIKNTEQTTRDAIANTTRLLQAQYSARLVTTEQYYAQQRDLLQQDTAAQEKSITAQIEYLRQRDVAGKDSINVGKQIADLEQRLAKVRADSSTQLAILGIQEQDVNRKRAESLEDYTLALQKNLDTAKLASDAELLRITQGAREAEQTTKIAKAYADLSKELERLALLKQRDPSNADVYDSEIEAAKRNTDAVVEHIVDAYDRLKDAQADWLNGLSSGLQDWMDNAADVASQVNKLTQSTLDTVVDGLTQAATTGKLAWRDMLADIGKQITKFMIQQAVLQFIKYFMDAWLGFGSGPGGAADAANQPIGSAKGNVFTNSPSLSAYSGTVVAKPTFFAKGGNVMGEAGPEGIFPLKRGSDGKLGVVAHGGGGGPVYVTTEVHVHSDGSSTSTTRTAGEQAAAYRELGDKISTGAKQEIQRALMPGGQIWKAQQRR